MFSFLRHTSFAFRWLKYLNYGLGQRFIISIFFIPRLSTLTRANIFSTGSSPLSKFPTTPRLRYNLERTTLQNDFIYFSAVSLCSVHHQYSRIISMLKARLSHP